MELHVIKSAIVAARFTSATILALITPIVLLLALSGQAQAKNAAKVAVLYPSVREPYIRIFREIIRGIAETIPDPIEQIAIQNDESAEEILSKLDEYEIESIIALGSRAQKLSVKLGRDRTVLTGAVFSTPSLDPLQQSSISMIVSPDALLKKLTDLAPGVNTIHVIYNSSKDQWVIELANKVLKGSQIKLNAMEANSVKGHARLYHELFKSRSLSNTDAVWLLQGDSSLKEPGIFATILENAWKQEFIVFSANPTHVRKGVLFAMYPDNRRLGVSLANKLLSLHNGESHSIDPLADLLVAVNIRTAEHLDLDFSRAERQSFNMVFPNR